MMSRDKKSSHDSELKRTQKKQNVEPQQSLNSRAEHNGDSKS